MIRLTKNPEPPILTANKAAWAAEYMRYITNGQTPPDNVVSRYRHADIKASLIQETSGKCAYCESRMLHVTFGDVEHILPRDAQPLLTFEWDNLTLACPRCNNNKRAYYSETDPLLNPYSDNPPEHLRALGPMVVALDSIRGDLTEKVIKLNRVELIEVRKERIERLLPLISSWRLENNAARKAVLKTQIEEEAKPDKEFSMVVTQFLADLNIA